MITLDAFYGAGSNKRSEIHIPFNSLTDNVSRAISRSLRQAS